MTATTLTKLPADAGTWRAVEGGYELRFERRLRHAPEKVWAAIATPEGIGRWFAQPDMEMKAGGRYDLRFDHPCTDTWTADDQARVRPNTVIAYDPPRLFAHTFGEGHVVRWELHPDGDGAWLVMTHYVPEKDLGELTGYLGGWTQHLRGLEAAVGGEKTIWNWDDWRTLKAAYDDEVKV